MIGSKYYNGIEAKQEVKISLSNNKAASKIRTLFCQLAADKNYEGNPLCDTDFNDLLDIIAKQSFEFGYEIAKEQFEDKK